MQEDRTVIMFTGHESGHQPDSAPFFREGIHVSLIKAYSMAGEARSFLDGFSAGRAEDNDIVIPSGVVSRHHLRVKLESDGWWVYDLGSANGSFIQDKLINQKCRLVLPTLIRLGDSEFCLKLESDSSSLQKSGKVPLSTYIPQESVVSHNTTSHRTNLTKEEIRSRLLADTERDDVGDYTRMVRTLIREDRASRGRKYKKWIWTFGVLFFLATGLVAYQHIALSNARSLAIDMFYDIKTLELSLAQAEISLEQHAALLKQQSTMLESTIQELKNEKLKEEQAKLAAEQKKLEEEQIRLAQERQKLHGMKKKYQQYVEEANSLRFKFPSASGYEDELIIRVAREFGESELEVPDSFADEVKKYIGYWRRSSRMNEAMNRLEKSNQASVIIDALQKQNLPAHFIYLPLQESNYNTQAIGPATRYGVAKGAWQFLATTGQEYGLTPGPLADSREFDPADQRFDFNKASYAGAKYLKQIYSTEAEASGLLVMAGYNYGHNRVKSMIKQMPDNPRDKNFWKFIQQYQIPQETYDYVFYIFSAAVIGEDPKYFGFRFDPPLKGAE